MTTNVLSAERQTTLVTTALKCSVTTVKGLATSPMTALTKLLHQEHLITTTGCIPGHTKTTTIETDHNPLTTDTVTEDASASYNHTTDLTVTEALATTKDVHPTPHPTMQKFMLSFDSLMP